MKTLKDLEKEVGEGCGMALDFGGQEGDEYCIKEELCDECRAKQDILNEVKEIIINEINEELTYYPVIAGKPTEWSKGLIHLAGKLKSKLGLSEEKQ